jgi:hypothetical protein
MNIEDLRYIFRNRIVKSQILDCKIDDHSIVTNLRHSASCIEELLPLLSSLEFNGFVDDVPIFKSVSNLNFKENF